MSNLFIILLDEGKILNRYPRIFIFDCETFGVRPLDKPPIIYYTLSSYIRNVCKASMTSLVRYTDRTLNIVIEKMDNAF